MWLSLPARSWQALVTSRFRSHVLISLAPFAILILVLTEWSSLSKHSGLSTNSLVDWGRVQLTGGPLPGSAEARAREHRAYGNLYSVRPFL